DEIGMRDIAIPFEEVCDPQGLNMPDKNLRRDPSRTPMQWDNSDNAGFTTAKPWLRIDKEYSRRNVSAQKGNPYSLLSLYRRLIELRNNEPALNSGEYRPVMSDGKLIAYIRELRQNSKKFLIILNLSHAPAYFKHDDTRLRG